jgi:hypothetical protein
MPIGPSNPCAFRVGGGPTSVQKAEKTLADAVGPHNAAEAGTLEAEWRFSKARGLASAVSADERSMYQAWPDTATDAIPGYEEQLGIIPSTDASDQERREAITDAWVNDPDAAVQALSDELQAIDPAFVIIERPFEVTRHVKSFGRAFEPFNPGPTNPEFFPETEVGESKLSNYSDEMRLIVQYSDLLGERLIDTREAPDDLTSDVGYGIQFAPNGIDFFFTVNGGNDVVRHQLDGDPWDTTAGSTLVDSHDVGAQDGSPLGAAVSPAGDRLLVVGASTDRIFQYNLATPNVLGAGVSFIGFFQMPSVNPRFLKVTQAGNRALTLDLLGQDVVQFNMSTGWDVSTMTDPSLTFDYSGEPETVAHGAPDGISFNHDESGIFLIWNVAGGGTVVVEFLFGTPLNVSTLTRGRDFSTGDLGGDVRGIGNRPGFDEHLFAQVDQGNDRLFGLFFYNQQTLTGENREKLFAAGELLNARLPAWVDFTLIATPPESDVGFFLDSTPLDVGAFGS